MDWLIKLLSESNMALNTFIALTTLVVVSFTIIFIIAFFQGRELKFWPPYIGKKQRIKNSPERKVNYAESVFYTDRPSYYKRYYHLVSQAKESVTMIGDGFACHDIQNNECASGLINAIRSALNNGIPVKRFQFHTTLSLAWLKLLCDLKEDFGDLFHVYMNKTYDPIALPYVICLVDHDEKDASVNVMFTRSSDTSLEEKLAGPALYLKAVKK